MWIIIFLLVYIIISLTEVSQNEAKNKEILKKRREMHLTWFGKNPKYIKANSFYNLRDSEKDFIANNPYFIKQDSPRIPMETYNKVDKRYRSGLNFNEDGELLTLEEKMLCHSYYSSPDSYRFKLNSWIHIDDFINDHIDDSELIRYSFEVKEVRCADCGSKFKKTFFKENDDEFIVEKHTRCPNCKHDVRFEIVNTKQESLKDDFVNTVKTHWNYVSYDDYLRVKSDISNDLYYNKVLYKILEEYYVEHVDNISFEMFLNELSQCSKEKELVSNDEVKLISLYIDAKKEWLKFFELEYKQLRKISEDLSLSRDKRDFAILKGGSLLISRNEAEAAVSDDLQKHTIYFCANWYFKKELTRDIANCIRKLSNKRMEKE